MDLLPKVKRNHLEHNEIPDGPDHDNLQVTLSITL